MHLSTQKSGSLKSEEYVDITMLLKGIGPTHTLLGVQGIVFTCGRDFSEGKCLSKDLNGVASASNRSIWACMPVYLPLLGKL